jgi:uncharacterized membrane protein
MREMAQEPEIVETPASTEENVYSVVYYALLGGMIVSSILFAIGIIRALMRPAYYPLDAAWVRSHYSFSWGMNGLKKLDPVALMMAGAILLILTPVARVIVSIYAFLVDHDFKFVAITGIVFLVMVLTVVAGLLGLQ